MSNDNKDFSKATFESEDELLDLKAEKELDIYLSDDILHDFLIIMRKYPQATREENAILVKKAQNGDSNAREELINKNLRLVVSRVSRLRRELKSVQKMDLIQEGIIGLMRAIDTYDETYSVFSTYATIWIDKKINRSLENNDNSIRVPVYIQELLYKYYRLMESNPKLKDEDICEALNIKPHTLKQIRELNHDTVSLSSPIKEDGDTELAAFVGYKDNSYNKILDEAADRVLLLFFKAKFSPLDYYIFYYRFISDPKIALESLGQELGISREYVRQREIKIVRKVKAYYSSDKTRRSSMKLDSFEQRHMERLKIKPLTPDNIIRFLYIRDHLSPKEQQVYKEMFFSKWEYNTSIFSQILNIDYEKLKEIEKSIFTKEHEIIDRNIDAYKAFKKVILNDLKVGIFKVKLDMPLAQYFNSLEYLFHYWKDQSYEDFLKYLSKCNAEIPKELEDNIKCFFGVNNIDDLHRKYLERDLNKYVFEFDKPVDIPPEKLLKALEKYRSNFTDKEYYILQYRLGKISKQNLKERYPDFNKYSTYEHLFNKLYRYYFEIKSYKQYNFTRDKYLKIRDKCIKAMDPLLIKMLDEFYKDEKEITQHEELAKKFDMDISTLKITIRKAKEQAINIYLDKRHNLKTEFEIYEEYLLWHDIDFTEPTKTIVEECIMLHHSYEEVSQKLGLDTAKISNFLTEAIWKINSYRFGIYFPDLPYSKDFMLNVLESSDRFSEFEKTYLKFYLDCKSSRKVIEKFGITKRNIIVATRKLYLLFRKEAVKDIEVSVDEIKKEIESDPIECVLTEKEKEYLSLKYGIQGKYNKEPLTLSEKQIKEHLKLSKNQFQDIQYCIEKVKAKKIGLMRNSLAFVNKEEMEELLKDVHVPVSSKERDLLIHIYGLYDAERLTFDDFSVKYKESKRSLLRRLQRAYIMVKRYQNGEIQGKVDFELDVKPYLKYFSKSDQEILTSYYKDGMTVKEIAVKNDLTLNMADALLYKLRIYLKDLQDGEVKGFDFDYFWSVVDKKDLPYFGDRDQAIEIFRLFYEDRLSCNEILSHYFKEIGSVQSLRYRIQGITFAVLKYKEGVKISRNYSYQEMRSYYLKHQEEMGLRHKRVYYNYFKHRKKENFSSKKLPLTIALDLASENEKYIHFNDSNRERVEEALKKYRDRIPKKNAKAMARVNGIHSRTTMNSHEIQQVLNFISGIKKPPSKVLQLN